MGTTKNTKNIEKVLANAFFIKRITTHHAKDFRENVLTRPVFISDFVDLLRFYDGNTGLSFFRKYGPHLKSGDFVNPQTEMFLEIGKNAVFIRVKKADELTIRLDRPAFMARYDFIEESLFTTDFGVLTHDENYYKNGFRVY